MAEFRAAANSIFFAVCKHVAVQFPGGLFELAA
jgi:hypothetical protein